MVVYQSSLVEAEGEEILEVEVPFANEGGYTTGKLEG